MLDPFKQRFSVLGQIGEGSFSEVLKVKEKRTGMYYAAKKLTKPYLSYEEVMNDAEIKTMKELDVHPNVISLVDVVYIEDPGNLILIFDLMDMSMFDFIKNRKRCLSEAKVKKYLYQLVCGLNHLHKNGIFHRDIKPENILIKINKNIRNNPKKSEIVQIADLGTVCRFNKTAPHSAYISTRWYRAPECLLTSGYYGPKMDIWALGCVFYEILTLNPLFPGDSELDQLNKIHDVVGSPSQTLLSVFKHKNVPYTFPKRNPVRFYNLVPILSDYGISILNKMLCYNPDIRINTKKLLEHIYFDDLRFKSKLSRRSSSVSLESSRSRSSNVSSNDFVPHKFSSRSVESNITSKKCDLNSSKTKKLPFYYL